MKLKTSLIIIIIIVVLITIGGITFAKDTSNSDSNTPDVDKTSITLNGITFNHEGFLIIGDQDCGFEKENDQFYQNFKPFYGKSDEYEFIALEHEETGVPIFICVVDSDSDFVFLDYLKTVPHTGGITESSPLELHNKNGVLIDRFFGIMTVDPTNNDYKTKLNIYELMDKYGDSEGSYVYFYNEDGKQVQISCPALFTNQGTVVNFTFFKPIIESLII